MARGQWSQTRRHIEASVSALENEQPMTIRQLFYRLVSVGEIENSLRDYAVRLRVDQITENKLFLYTQKTGVPVYAVLPEFVLRTLDATPRSATAHFFWSGTGTLDGVVSSWRKRLAKLFCKAGIPSGHAHRFRDSFATELLLGGTPLNEWQSFSAIRASRSRRSITRPGLTQGNVRLKQTYSGPGSAIRYCSSKRRVRQRYTEKARSLTE